MSRLADEVMFTVEIANDPEVEGEQPAGDEAWGRAMAAAAKLRATKDFIFKSAVEVMAVLMYSVICNDKSSEECTDEREISHFLIYG